jgi:hypothetical protein
MKFIKKLLLLEWIFLSKVNYSAGDDWKDDNDGLEDDDDAGLDPADQNCEKKRVDVLIVGAGLAGKYLLVVR